MTEWSSGELTFTICPSWACTVSSQPTPQYGQIVSVRVCRVSSQVPAWRISLFGFAHQRTGGAHADTVSAIHACRVGQRNFEFRGNVRVEPASGNADSQTCFAHPRRNLPKQLGAEDWITPLMLAEGPMTRRTWHAALSASLLSIEIDGT